MDFLQNLVIPATTQHLLMIKVILGLAMIIFLPFFGMLLGGTAFSVIFNSYGRKNNKPMYIRFAKDIIDKLIKLGADIYCQKKPELEDANIG